MSTIPPPTLNENDQLFVRSVVQTYACKAWPQEELESVIKDSVRLIRSIASQYTDNTRVELNFSELESEGRARLIKRLMGTERSPSVLTQFAGRRVEFFKHLKSCLSNHIKGIVFRNVYTAKRVGRKAPLRRLKGFSDLHDKMQGSDAYQDLVVKFAEKFGGDFGGADHEDAFNFLSRKSEDLVIGKINEFIAKSERSWRPDVSFDDPDTSRAVEAAAHRETVGNWDQTQMFEFEADMETILLPAELAVYRQLASPNQHALALATLDAYRGRAVGEPLDIRISREHMAVGVGLDLATFSALAEQVKEKINAYMHTDESGHQNAAISSLESIFGIQIPRAMPPAIVKRLLTLVARDNFTKVTPEVEDMLKLVGAKPPSFDGSGGLTCFGVLFQKNNRVCSVCGLRLQCETEAANYGLGTVVLSTKLFSERALARTAALSPEQPEPSAPLAVKTEPTEETAEVPAEKPTASGNTEPLTVRDELIKSYLEGNFTPAPFKGHRYYRHNGVRKDGKIKHLFCLLNGKKGLTLRFCKPSAKLAKSLTAAERGTFEAPVDLPFEQLKKLINQHADERFKEA